MSLARTPLPQDARAADGEPDFSLVLGGPLFQVLRRAGLADDALGLTHRRIAAAVLIMWAPLLLLSALQGGLYGTGVPMPFIKDVGFQLRFLVVAPLLIVAELVVHLRLRPVIAQFRGRGLVRAADAGRFEAATEEAARWRNAIAAELLLLAIVYAAGIFFTLRRYLEMRASGWWALPGGGISLAGYWLVFVSLPLLQFLLLRWYFRLFVWGRFLWRISRLNLDLNATHPDKAGGLGFLGEAVGAFAPIALAHGVLLAGMLSDRILFAGAKLTDFKIEVLGGAVFLLAVFAGPLTVFVPRLARVKRAGLREYGALGQTYVRDFRRRWFSGSEAGDALLGSGDIQSLADLGNSYGAAEQMRLAPIQPSSLLVFLAAFLAPIAPLLLTMMSMEKLLAQLVGIIF